MQSLTQSADSAHMGNMTSVTRPFSNISHGPRYMYKAKGEREGKRERKNGPVWSTLGN